jgi:predicted MFS family arabinose efflux permease
MAAGIVPALVWSSTGVLLASRLVVGAAEGAMMSAAVLWLLRLAGPERRGVALGHIGLANYAGLTAGPPLASALGLSRTSVLVAAAVLPLAGAALALTARRPERERPVDDRGGVLRATLVPGIGLMLVNVGYVALLAFGEQASGSGLIVPVFAAGVIAVRTFGATVPDRVGAGRTATASAVIGAAGLLVVALAGAPAPALAGAAVLAVGQGFAVPSFGLLALARVPAARQGAAAGMFFAFFDAGVGAGGPLTGVVARVASPVTALTVAAGVFATSGAIALRATMAR